MTSLEIVNGHIEALEIFNDNKVVIEKEHLQQIKQDLEKYNYCLQFLRELFQIIEYNSGILYDYEEDTEEPIFQLKCDEHIMDITEELYFLLVNLEYKILKEKVGDNQ